MNPEKDIKPISYVKAHAAEMISQVTETGRPLFVTQNGEAKAVLIDVKSYNKTRETLKLLEVMAQGERDIQAGRTIPHEEVTKAMEKKFARLRKERNAHAS